MNDPASEFDPDLAKLLGAQKAASQQALSSVTDFADVLNTFRVRLLVGGMPAEEAMDMTKDYFGAVLDTLVGRPAEVLED